MNIKRLEELKRNENLLHLLVAELQVYFADNSRLECYLKKIGFTKKEVKKIMINS